MGQNENKRLLEAVERIKDRVRNHPEEMIDLLYRMAELYCEAGMYLPAAQALTHLLKHQPLHLRGLLLLARTWVRRKDLIRAIQVYATIESVLPAMKEPYLGQYACFRRLGRTHSACAALQRLIERFPSLDRPRRLLIDLLAESGQAAEAAEEVQQTLDRCPEPDPQLLLRCARLHFAAGASREAVAYLRETVRVDPSRKLAWSLLASTYQTRRDWPAARGAARSLLKLAPATMEGHETLGKSCLALGEYDRAIVALDRVIELGGDTPGVHFLRAEALFCSNELKEAREIFEKLVRDTPWDARVHLRLGQIEARKNREDRAIRHLETAVRLAPDTALAHLLLGELHGKHGRTVASLKSFRRLLVLRPRNLKAHMNLGRLYRKTGDEEKARHHLHTAGRLSPGNAEAYLELGRLHRERQRPALARDLFGRVLDLAPRGDLATHARYELRLLEQEAQAPSRRASNPADAPAPRTASAGRSGGRPTRGPRPKVVHWKKLC